MQGTSENSTKSRKRQMQVHIHPRRSRSRIKNTKKQKTLEQHEKHKDKGKEKKCKHPQEPNIMPINTVTMEDVYHGKNQEDSEKLCSMGAGLLEWELRSIVSKARVITKSRGAMAVEVELWTNMLKSCHEMQSVLQPLVPVAQVQPEAQTHQGRHPVDGECRTEHQRQSVLHHAGGNAVAG